MFFIKKRPILRTLILLYIIGSILVVHELCSKIVTNNPFITPTPIKNNKEADLVTREKASGGDERMTLEKTIQPGNHTNIPGTESRIGPTGDKAYVHDPKFLIKNPSPFKIPDIDRERLCLAPGEGDELPEGARNLEKIRSHMETSKEIRNVQLFCAVYTHNGGINHTNAIKDTWGKRCDGLLFAGSESNATTGHMHLPSNSRQGFGYRGMIQRTRTILAYMYDNFLDEYDYFHIGGDDIYLMVENLKEFLASEKVKKWDEVPDQYLFAGFWLHWGKMEEGYFYLGGGSGYTLSRKALKAYVEGPLQTCNVNREGSAEDLAFSDCARELSTKFIDTRDSAGAHRYHQLPVQQHSLFPSHRSWGIFTRIIRESLMHMQRNFSYPIVYEDAYISKSSIVFHKHDPVQIRRYELILYGNINAECGDELTKNLTTKKE